MKKLFSAKISKSVYHFRPRRLGWLVVLLLALVGIIFIQKFADSANESFFQTTWQDGADIVATAAHPGNKTGWSKYYSAESQVRTSVPGKVILDQNTFSVTDTTDTDFGTGTKTNLTVSGTGTAASVVMQGGSQDLFRNDLQLWSSEVPQMPALHDYSAFVKVGNDLYAFWSGKTFAKYTTSTGTWTFLKDAPKPIGYGAALAYPETGDLIYATRGANTKDFWSYNKATDTWTELKEANFPIGQGGSLAMVNTTEVYCLVGGSTNKFMEYSVASDSWTNRTDIARTVYHGGSLAWPGVDSYIYANNSYSERYLYRFNTVNKQWYTLPIASSTYGNTYDISYPGDYTGTTRFIYAPTSSGYLVRFNLSSQAWEYPPARMPIFPSVKGIVFYPGSGTKLKYLSRKDYYDTVDFETATDTFDADAVRLYVGSYIRRGSRYIWDGGNYLYKNRGDNDYRNYARYHITNKTWESLPDSIDGGTYLRTSYYGSDGAYHSNELYYLKGYNTTQFFKYTPATTSWTNLAVTPVNVYYGGSLTSDGTYLYAFAGSSSPNTFMRYTPDAGAGTWDDNVVADIPLGTTNRNLDGGAALVYHANFGDNIYAMRGNYTPEFWKYDKLNNTWTQLADMPFSAVNKGTLTYPGSGDYIYAFPGTWNGFARYKFQGTGADTWEVLPGTPNSQGHYYVAAAVGDKIYYNYYEYEDDLLYTYTISTGEWSALMDEWSSYGSPFYSGFHGSIVHTGGDDAYIVGSTWPYSSQTIWKYSIANKRFTGMIKTPFLMGRGTKAAYPGSGNKFYVLRGNQSKEFYSYDFVLGTWSAKGALADAPFPISAGSQFDGSGNLLFACEGVDTDIVGNSSWPGYGFAKYDISLNTWTEYTGNSDLPDYIRSSYYYGNKLAYVPTQGTQGTVYWTSYDDNYLRKFDVQTAAWSTTINRPSGTSYVRGAGALYYPGSGNDLYLFTGSSYHRFFKYNIAGSWTELARPPFIDGYDSDMFKSGDYIYLTNARYGDFARYSITNDAWDMEVANPSSRAYEYYSVFGGGEENTLYAGGYDSFYKYDTTTRIWTGISDPYDDRTAYGGGSNWRWDEWFPQIVYPGKGDYLFSTRGRNRSNFAKYSISGNKWYELASPGTYNSGHSLAASNTKVWLLFGGITKTFKEYDIQSDTWTARTNFPQNANFGASLSYPGKGDFVYAARGDNTQEFYKYSISAKNWTQLADVPAKLQSNYGQTSLVYPGAGDYLYLSVASTRSWDNGASQATFRYSITNNTWEEVEPNTLAMRSPGRLAYPKDSDYIYAGFGRYGWYRPIRRFYALKTGTYVSEGKNIGINKGFNIVTWNDVGNGSLEFQARTADDSAMSGATAWDDVPVREKNEDLSLSYPAVEDSKKYMQYKLKFICDDLTALPALNDLTLKYDKYPQKQELISSPYDSGQAANRLMGLSWNETAVTGTDIKLQLRTAPDSGGSPGAWSAWLGPSGTQAIVDDYSTEPDYVYGTGIEVTTGLGRLLKYYETFDYTQRIVLDFTNGASDLTNSVITINIDSTNPDFWKNVKSDGSDIRFSDTAGNAIAHNYTAGGASFDYANKTAKIYVKIPLLTAGAKKTIYLKYGNAGATTLSDGTVIPIWEDFAGTTVNSSKFYWSGGQTPTQNEELTLINDNDSWDFGFISQDTFQREAGLSFFAKYKEGGTQYSMIGWHDSGTGLGYSSLVYGIYFNNTNVYVYEKGSNRGLKASSYSKNTWYDIKITLKAVGATYYWRPSGTSTWNLLYDSSNYSDATLKVAVHPNRNDSNVWTDDWDISTQANPGLGAVPDGLDIYFGSIESKDTSPSLSGWEYREEIEIDNTSGGKLTNYQYQVNLNSASDGFWAKTRSDGFDIRFVDSDNTTILDHYRQSFNYSAKTAVLFVEVPLVPAASTKRIYLYYGKASAADTSSFDNTMAKDFQEIGYNTSGISLDGAGGGITVPDSASLDITANLTLEANVKYTADTWLPGFAYRKTVTLDNSSGTAGTDVAVSFDVTHLTAKMNSDFSDLRFVDTDGTKLRYKIDSYTADTTATFVVLIPNLPVSTKDIYMYYGNAGAADESDVTIGGAGYLGNPNSVRLSRYNDSNATANNEIEMNSTFATGLTFVADSFPTTIYGSQSADNYSVYITGYINAPTTGTYYFGTDSDDASELRMGDDIEFNKADPKGTVIASWYGGHGFSGNYSLHSGSIVLTAGWQPFVYRMQEGGGGDGYRLGWKKPGDSSYVTIPSASFRATSLHVDEAGKMAKGGIPFTPAFAAEEAQPAIDELILGKAGAYELRFTQNGLSGYLNGAEVVSTPNYTATGKFMHIAMAYDGANVKLYSDGSLKASASQAGAINTNANALSIGTGIKGVIDEVRVWSIARAAGSIDEDKTKYIDAASSGLAAYLRLNENLGTAVNDATANNNNGTFVTGAGWAANPFSYSNGKPVLIYHFDEGVGTDSQDSSGNGSRLYFSNASFSGSDLLGFSASDSMSLPLGNSYGYAYDAANLDIGGKISLEAWIKPTANVDIYTIFYKGLTTAPRYNYALIQNGDKIKFAFYNGADKAHETEGFITVNTTYHVVATFDENTDEVKIYVDGVEKYSGTETSSMVVNDDNFYVGNTNPVGNDFMGSIDGVRIYKRILSLDEIQAHYAKRIAAENDPLVYKVTEPPAVAGVGVFSTANPVIQPVNGIFYEGGNIGSFVEVTTKPYNTGIGYQISYNGYNWFWYTAGAWAEVSGGYSQTNTASEVSANLAAFMAAHPDGYFAYRAYLHADASAMRRPSLDSVSMTVISGGSYYDPAGSLAINDMHDDADSDQWFQYKAILYSDGEDSPILGDITLDYLNAYTTVLTPNGGEDIAVGSSYNITWSSQAINNGTGNVKLEYSDDGGNTYFTIADNLADTGTYTWNPIPDTPGQNSYVRVSSKDLPNISDVSDAVFRILALEVTSPNGSEVWEVGKTHNITWTSTGNIPNNVVKIEYSTDGGSTWNGVTGIAPDTGTYAWTVPAAASDNSLVRVSNSTDTEIMDTTDVAFSIVPTPAFSFTAPVGGENMSLGLPFTISWAANSLQTASEVKLSYSKDNFVADNNTIITVSSGTPQGANPNDDIIGSYDWTVPDDVSSTVRVKIEETTIPAGRDTQQIISQKSNEFSIIEPTITLTSPALGDIWVAGDTNQITWTAVGAVSNNLLLEYSINGTDYVQIAAAETNDGAYDWVIPAQAAGSTVTVRITDSDRVAVTDISDQFEVLSQARITVGQPNGLESLVMGTTYDITWSTIGNQLSLTGPDYSEINIYYSTNNGTDWNLAAFRTNNDGSYTWTVPDLANESSQALIKIEDNNDTGIKDQSDNVFTIAYPTITITSPTGTEIWYATGSYDITWTTVGAVSNNLTLQYSDDGGTTWTGIAAGEANDGTYTWPVADVDSSTVLIKMIDADKVAVTDISDAVFTIVPPSISVADPNGGEQAAVGESYAIRWTSLGYDVGAISDSLTLQYSSNNGTSWNAIATGEANDGSFSWTVPDDVSSSCLIRIFDSLRPATTDDSDAVFEIVVPYIEITAPSGGEQYPIGTVKAVTWTWVGTISNNLKLEYSKDNFITTTQMATGEANDGTYDWPVPDDKSATVKIRITDLNRPAVTYTTLASFAIVDPQISVTAPNGGELWTVGDSENIAWDNIGSVGSAVTIQYSKDMFVSDVNVISTNAPNSGVSGSFAWTIANDLSSNVRVKVIDNSRATVKDISNASFTILPAPTITISAPALAEEWPVGSTKTITWSDNGGLISNNLEIAYSTAGAGGPWTVLATSEANDGSYDLTSVPDAVSNTVVIRIKDLDRVSTIGLSAVFKITEPKITITSPSAGEIWSVGDLAPITWTTEGTVSNNLILEYSPNGGTDWYLEIAGQNNTGAYTWNVDSNAMSGNAKFRITDGNRLSAIGESAAFIVNSIPTITITNPLPGNEWVLLDTKQIQWTYTGLSISNNLLIQLSNNDFATSQIVATGEANDGAYDWNITEDTLTGSTLKMRITDANRTEIKGEMAGYFKIRGGFTLNQPNGGEQWTAKSNQTVSWQTRGNVTNVKLDYTVNDGVNWSTIAASIPNTGTYTWALPDIQSTNVKFRISDTTDPTVKDESDAAFSIVYQSVQFKILDYDTLEHLADISVNEPASGWNDTGLNSAIDRANSYPYGTYSTFFTKTNYIDNSVTWSPPKSGTDTYIITIYLENSASAQVTWESILTYSFSPATDTLTAVGSLQRKGKLVGTRAVERLDMGAAIFIIYEPDGSTVKHTLTANQPSDTGMYNFTLANTAFAAGYVYPATLSIDYRNRPYISTANIDVGSEILQYEFFTQTATQLATSVQSIEAAVAGGTAQTRSDIQAARLETKTDIAASKTSLETYISTAEETLTSEVEQAREQTKIAMKSRILNRNSTVKQNTKAIIRFRTYSGLAPVISVYDAKNIQRVINAVMTEIGTTGIYEYEVNFKWGKGDYSIIASESTKGVMDGLIMTVLSSDITSVAGQVSAVLGTTAGLSDIGDTAETLNNQIGSIESALSNISKDVVKNVKEAVGRVEGMENVFKKLNEVGKRIKELKGAQDVNLDEIFELEEGKKDDMDYLKNKTNEIKAVMELNQKMIDNVANEPIIQTWYEYKSVVIKAIIVNPSETQTKVVPFKIYLPKEAKPEHVMFKGELKVAYDTQQGSYYVHNNYEMGPKESKIIEIEMKDIWIVELAEIMQIKKEAKKVYGLLRNTEFSDRAKYLLNQIEDNLSTIEEKQETKEVNPEVHISNYRDNMVLLDEAKKNLALARTLLSQAAPFSVRATWKVIVWIVIFLGILSLGFYLIWQKQVSINPDVVKEGKTETDQQDKA